MSHQGSSTACTLSRRSVLAGVSAMSAMAAIPARAKVVSNVVIGSGGWLYPAWEDVRDVVPARWPAVTRSINGYIAQLKKHGIQTVISLTPTKARIYPEFLPADFRSSADGNRRYDAARAMLLQPGTPVPDLASMFTGWRQTPAYPPPPPNPDFQFVGNDVFFKADSHWTTNAASPSATAFAGVLKTLGLPASDKPGTVLGAATETVQEQNDLAELLPAGQPAQYAVESYMLPQVQNTGGLLSDDPADVVVIGNSFMQPKYGFVDMLSNQLGRPVALDWKIDRFGPYTTLLEYIQSAPFKAARPKVIIWNFREAHMEFLINDSDAWGPSAMPDATLSAAIDQIAGG